MKTILLCLTLILLINLSSASMFGYENPNIPNLNSIIEDIRTFLGLSDTPNSYIGEAGDCVLVNAGETGLEFAPCAGAGLTNIFDQWLNTTSNVTFYNITATGNISAGGVICDSTGCIGSGGGGISSATANATYLKLDTSNDPLTGDLEITKPTVSTVDLNFSADDGEVGIIRYSSTFMELLGIYDTDFFVAENLFVMNNVSIYNNLSVLQNVDIGGNVSASGIVCDSVGCIGSGGGNASWNQSLADDLYVDVAGDIMAGNLSIGGQEIINVSYIRTYGEMGDPGYLSYIAGLGASNSLVFFSGDVAENTTALTLYGNKGLEYDSSGSSLPFFPHDDNYIDIGKPSKRWRDAYFSGNITTNNITSNDWWNVSIATAQLYDFLYNYNQTTTDTNASTECTGDEVLLGNTSCMSIATFSITESDPIWTANSTLVPYLSRSNTFTAINNFTKDIKLQQGNGITILHPTAIFGTATLNLPPNSGDIPSTGALNTWTATQTFNTANINFAQKISHYGDADTYIKFTLDAINFTVGGVNFLEIIEAGSDLAIWHEDVKFEKEVDGSLVYLAGGGYGNAISASRYLKTYNGADFAANRGFPMPRAGSLTDLSVGANCNSVVGPGEWDIEVRINGAPVASLTVTLDTSTTGDKAGVSTTARDTADAVYLIGDNISFYATETVDDSSIQDLKVNVYGYFD